MELRLRQPSPTILLVVTLTVLGLACGPGGSVTSTPTSLPETPTSSPEQRVPATHTRPIPPTRTPQPSPTTRPSPPTIPAGPLSAEGPWLVLETQDGIWAANPDGSGLSQLVAWRSMPPTHLSLATTPNGGHFAFVLGSDEIHNLTLYVLSLPDGEIEAAIPLTSVETEPELGPVTYPTDPGVSALTHWDSLEWSPDGQRLAFVGMMDGQSADLYVYSLVDGSVFRLTYGPGQAARPSWSPDSQDIFHIGLRDFEGPNVAGVWVVRVDGSEVRELPVSTQGDLVPLGWQDPQTIVLYSYREGWSKDLIRCDVETGQVDMLWEGFFTEAALAPSSENLLVAIDVVSAHENHGDPGLYLVRPGQPATRLVDRDTDMVSWSPEAAAFLAEADPEQILVTSTGQMTTLRHPHADRVSPVEASSAGWLAWMGDSAWISSLSDQTAPPREVYTGSFTWQANWSPDGQHLVFLTDFAVYVARGPAFVPVPLPFEPVLPVYPYWIVP